jgi:hypothetical protein
MHSHRLALRTSSLAVLLSLVLAGCNMPASGGASVWVDVPLDGLNFPAVQEINIEGHAAAPGGVRQVEIWIDGTLLTTVSNPPTEGDLASFGARWTPPGAGTYTIQAIAMSAGGAASAPDSARVTFGGKSPVGCPSPVGGGPTPVSCEVTPVGCPSPVGGGPTPPPPCGPAPVGCPSPVGGGPTPVSCLELPIITVIVPGATVEFWADPAEIDAGTCTNIRWHTANVRQVVFGGINQSLDGSYEACLCEGERYSLTVTHLDGSEERRSVDVAVSGDCITPEPVDGEGPPAPEPAVPANGLSIQCVGSQNLVWLPVDDPSGIGGYSVQVQRHSGGGNWQDAPGGGSGIQGKQTSIGVECGWYYRWRVRATDGAGNVGGWSGWSEFSVLLG